LELVWLEFFIRNLKFNLLSFTVDLIPYLIPFFILIPKNDKVLKPSIGVVLNYVTMLHLSIEPMPPTHHHPIQWPFIQFPTHTRHLTGSLQKSIPDFSHCHLSRCAALTVSPFIPSFKTFPAGQRVVVFF